VFARAVNEDDTIKSALNNVILFKVNAEKGEGVALAKKYEITGYPSFIAINAKGEVSDRWIGYGGPEAWSTSAMMAAADPRTIEEKKVAFKSEPTIELARCLASDASTRKDSVGAIDYYRQARAIDTENAGEYTESILTAMFRGTRSGDFTFDEFEAEAKASLESHEASAEQQVDLARMALSLAQNSGEAERSKNTAAAAPYVASALKASEGTENEAVASSRERLAIDNALYIDGDKEEALKLFRASMNEGWMEKSSSLNNFAWWCFENDINLEEAGELAVRGIELAETDADRANVLDTAAEICNKLGNCEQAVEHMERAVELDPDRKYFQNQLVRFQEVVAEKKAG
jgi:tetratricopeptide (TPR) repeat protein